MTLTLCIPTSIIKLLSLSSAVARILGARYLAYWQSVLIWMKEQSMANQTELAECAHHWIIETPNGPTSIGECRICRERKEFPNSLAHTGWEKEAPTKPNVGSLNGFIEATIENN